jgi:hypothetical protein
VYFTSQGRHLKNLKLTLDNNQGTSMNWKSRDTRQYSTQHTGRRWTKFKKKPNNT